ncbi:MAG TPA: hypothetical protein VFH58_02455 [Acidimicrobiales bacterium]|nr:hypothetical protein [Acidimicrobiales bacterium]
MTAPAPTTTATAAANAPAGTLAFTGPPSYVRLAAWLALALVLLGSLLLLWGRRDPEARTLLGG